MKYTIAFKSGKSLEFDVNDGVALVADINNGIANNPAAVVQMYSIQGVLLSLAEIEFIAPSVFEKIDDLPLTRSKN